MNKRKTRAELMALYAASHSHPVNRFLHTLGIPMIAVAIPLFGWRIHVVPLAARDRSEVCLSFARALAELITRFH